VTRFVQLVVDGLGQGSIYALLAVGFVIIYKATRVISFAQPALMVTGACFVIYMATERDWNFFGSVVLAVAATAVVALIIERLALRPMVGKPVFVVAIITIGVDVVLRLFVNHYLGLDVPRPVGDPWGLDTLSVGGIDVEERRLATMAVAAAVVTALFAFFKYSRMGLAMRATAADQETSLAHGVSVGTVFALSWAIAGALAALAGALVGTGSGVDLGTWTVALKALPAIILGGLDSVGGAVIGGLAVGVVETLVGGYQSDWFPWLGNNFSFISPYVLMLGVLLVRPYGLFGTPEIERV
jgi:branched-chain amino acid transport system permease protein